MVNNDLVSFSTGFKYMRLQTEYLISVTSASGVSGSGSATHGLGYIPYYQVWVDIQGVLIPAASSGFITTPDLLTTDITVRVDESDINIEQLHFTAGTHQYDYYVKIYEDPPV